MTAVVNTIDTSMALVSSLSVPLVLGLFSYCLVVYGEPNNTDRGGLLDDYIETVVKRQLERMKSEVEKQLEEKVNKLCNEKEGKDKGKDKLRIYR